MEKIEKNEAGKREKSRYKIMHVAKSLFEENGLENVTFNDIALKADVCRTTVFNHFANIDELMIALCEQEIIDIEEHCERTRTTGMPLIISLFDKLIEDNSLYPLLMTKLTNHTILSKENEKSIVRIENLVEKNIDVANKEQMAMLFMGAYYGMVNHYHSNNKKFDSNKMKKEFHELIKILKGDLK